MKILLVAFLLFLSASAHAQENWRADVAVVGSVSNGVFGSPIPGDDLSLGYRLSGAYILPLPVSEIQFFGRFGMGQTVITDIEDRDRFRFSRLYAGAMWTGYDVPALGTLPTVEFAVGLPTHDGADVTTELALITGKLRLEQPIFDDILRLGVEAEGGKFFHESTSPQFELSQLDNRTTGNSSNRNDVIISGVNPEFFWFLGAVARAQLTRWLRMDMIVGYVQFYSYDRDSGAGSDEFVPAEFIDVGRAVFQRARFKMEFGVPVLKLDGFTGEVFGGWSTLQPSKTSDDQTINLPLWSPSERRETQMFVGFSGRFGKRSDYEPRMFR